MKMRSSVFFLFAILCFASCRKENHNLEKGTYSGTWDLTVGSSGTTGPVTLEILNRKFDATIMQANGTNVECKGVFRTDNDIVEFSDDDAKQIWGTDMNVLLSGQFAHPDNARLILISDRGDAGRLRFTLDKVK